jgi:hypothetical protein
MADNVAVINKATNIPSNYSCTCSGHSLFNILCGVNSSRKEAGIIIDSDGPIFFIQSGGKYQ